MSNELMIDFPSPCNMYVLTIEDDGKTGYGYLKHMDRIVGDVWLYNRCEAPETTEWQDKKNLPFANCKGYVNPQGLMERDVSADDINIDWDYGKAGLVVYVYFFEDLYGALRPNDKPGYARFAIKSGPLAKVMEMEN
ncbi:hypothetical protein [Zavarzinella formosa]|uniref:hypothetical protein n=1 Tax=Zavarzinella formosa TaxID=360055 RepID=UPI0003161254|nr:hypothetical protein [Zavarzinella formosa]